MIRESCYFLPFIISHPWLFEHPNFPSKKRPIVVRRRGKRYRLQISLKSGKIEIVARWFGGSWNIGKIWRILQTLATLWILSVFLVCIRSKFSFFWQRFSFFSRYLFLFHNLPVLFSTRTEDTSFGQEELFGNFCTIWWRNIRYNLWFISILYVLTGNVWKLANIEHAKYWGYQIVTKGLLAFFFFLLDSWWKIHLSCFIKYDVVISKWER